jgi:predicted metal-dependent phosphoesterase TrpH
VLNLYQQLATCDGAAWFYADLHIHTPASFDFKWDGLDKDLFDEYKYVGRMLELGLHVVAITDHSSAGWVDRMKKAAHKLREKKRGRLVVLPGVEISVGGIHLCLVFHEDRTQEELNDVLSLLKIAPPKRGKAETICPLGIQEAIKIAHDKGGLVIGAHCLSSKAGVLDAINGQVRQQALAGIDVLEVKPQHDLVAAQEKAARCGWRGGPFIVSTDAHSPDELRPELTRIKAAAPSFHGLGQIAFEPQHRVGIGIPPSVAHSRLLGFETTWGIYKEELFRFSPHLNVLIGGRGAGKSAALDLLRFAFDVPPRRAENSWDFANRIRGFLGDNGFIHVLVTDADSKTVCIKRNSAHSVKRGRNGQEDITFLHHPKVFELIGDKFIETEATPLERFPVEFYGQGEVLELTRKADDQLKLIDEHVDFGDRLDTEKTLQDQLRQNASVISQFEEKRETLEQRVAEKGILEPRVLYLRTQLSDPVFASRELWKAEASHLQSVAEELGSLSSMVSTSLTVTTLARADLSPQTPNPEIVLEAANIPVEFVGKISTARAQLGTTGAELLQRFVALHTKWKVLESDAESQFQAKLIEMGGMDLQSLHNELIEKQEQLFDIVNNLEPELKAIRERVEAAWKEQLRLVMALEQCRDSIHSSRRDQVESLMAKMRGAVRIEVLKAGDRAAYSAYVKSMYEGSGILRADAQLTLVCDNLSPRELFEYILSRNEERLVARAGVTPNTAQKLVNHPKLKAVLELPLVSTPDAPLISLKREGDTSFTPLGQLSFGERCSAILSIALLDKNKPLVVDQPEDELDHSFITQDIVEGIRAIKSGRQIIVATHNPNIPVLGDAELVLRLAKQPAHQVCRILAQGALEKEDVLPHVLALEGGKDAFERRRQRYGLV